MIYAREIFWRVTFLLLYLTWRCVIFYTRVTPVTHLKVKLKVYLALRFLPWDQIIRSAEPVTLK
jgi:hypothetical protein